MHLNVASLAISDWWSRKLTVNSTLQDQSMHLSLIYCFELQATFEDELIDDAKAKKHSLTCEAVEVGAKVSHARAANHNPMYTHIKVVAMHDRATRGTSWCAQLYNVFRMPVPCSSLQSHVTL